MRDIVDTLPKILKANKERYGDDKVAMRKKDMGIWKEYTWKDVYENVKQISLGLLYIGFKRGDNIAIIGDTDPQWYWAEYAAQACGGTATGIYGDARSEELLNLVQGCDANVAFVKGQEQVDNINEILDHLPDLKKIVYWDSRGMQHYSDPILTSFQDLQASGRIYGEAHPNCFENSVDRGDGEEDAAICYVQEATGALPTAVVLTHRYLLANHYLFFKYDSWCDTGIFVSHVPPVSALDQTIAVATALATAVQISFPEGPDTFNNDMREMGPHYLYYVGSFWEHLVADIQANMNRSSHFKKTLYDLSVAIGHTVTDCHFRKVKPTFGQKSAWFLANLLVLRPLRNNLGLGRVRSAYQGGDLLGSEYVRFLHSIGVHVKQIYGHPQCGLVSMHREHDVRPTTVGLAIQEGAITIDETGAIFHSTDGVPIGRLKESAASEPIVRQKEKLHTGHIGSFDENGHLIVLGGKDGVFRSRNGTTVSLEIIEAKLRFHPHINHAMLIAGGECGFVSAIIGISYENVGEWAKNNHVSYSSFVDLSQHVQVYHLIENIIKKVNNDLPQELQIRRFLNLHKPMDVDDGELTRNGCLRRRNILERYDRIIAAINDGEEEYLDGSASGLKAGIAIRSIPE